MEYWLDWYALRIVGMFREFEASEGRISQLNNSQALRGLIAEACRQWQNPAIRRETSERNARAWFANLVAPLASPKDDDVPPLAIRFDEALILKYPRVFADNDVVAEGRNILSRHSVVYLDLADRLFMMPGDVFQARALFVWQEADVTRFCAILTRPGTNKGWRIAWREGYHERNQDDHAFDNVWQVPSEDIHDRYRPMNFQRIDYGKLPDLESLVWLSLVCWQHVRDNGLIPMPPEPLEPYTAEILAMEVCGEGISDAKISLFQVIRMPPIDEYRVSEARRALSRRSNGRCRHEVKGHYRWQACGKGLKERRRTLIRSHKRGSGALKTLLYVPPVESLVEVPYRIL